MGESTLAPCPFCRGEAVYRYRVTFCADADCPGHSVNATPEQWNRRAPATRENTEDTLLGPNSGTPPFGDAEQLARLDRAEAELDAGMGVDITSLIDRLRAKDDAWVAEYQKRKIRRKDAIRQHSRAIDHGFSSDEIALLALEVEAAEAALDAHVGVLQDG